MEGTEEIISTIAQLPNGILVKLPGKLLESSAKNFLDLDILTNIAGRHMICIPNER